MTYHGKRALRPIADKHRELAEPGALPTGHRISDDARMGYSQFNPSRGSNALNGVMGGFNVLNEYATLIRDQREIVEKWARQNAGRQIRDQIAQLLPENEPFSIYISGAATRDEKVVVVLGGTDSRRPGMHAGGQQQVVGRGANPLSKNPSGDVFYIGTDGKVHKAAVIRPAELSNTRPSVAPHREPGTGDGLRRERDVIRDGGTLPARGDLDPDHPHYREPGSLA